MTPILKRNAPPAHLPANTRTVMAILDNLSQSLSPIYHCHFESADNPISSLMDSKFTFRLVPSNLFMVMGAAERVITITP
jgi:hypothetical protein